MPRSEQVWINGDLRDAATPWLRPDCAGWLTGRGVFETILGRDGAPVHLARHWRRLANGTQRLGLETPDMETLAAAIRLLLEENGCAKVRARVRLTVVPGTVLLTATPLSPYPATVSVWISPFVRNERGALAGIKSTSYAENLLAWEEAKARGAGEAILGNTRGELCEGATSNVFWVEREVVCTPPLNSGCLPGVMREVVIEWCQAHRVNVCEEPLSLEGFRGATEAFLTSSLRGVQPVDRIDERPVQAPGKVTAMLRTALCQE